MRAHLEVLTHHVLVLVGGLHVAPLEARMRVVEGKVSAAISLPLGQGHDCPAHQI